MTAPLSVGRLLKRTRVELQLSVKDVTQETKIQPWVLESLEEDRLHTTMSPIYVKSFLASYAKFLRLDPAPLIVQLFPPEPAPEPSAEPTSIMKWSWPPLPSPSDALQALRPFLQRAAVLVVGGAALTLVVMTNPLKTLSPKTLPKHASVSVVKDRPRVVAPPTMDLQPTAPLELTLTVHRPTWVSINADGKLLVHQQLAAGSQETWKARRHFELIVAKPAHVDVVLNGQSISPLALAHQGRLRITHKQIAPLPESAPQ